MLSYMIRRIGHALIVTLIVSVLVFWMIRLIPGDPIMVMLGDEFSPEAYEQLKIEMGLDKPSYIQFFIWMKNILQGNFGYSYISHKKISDLLRDALPATLSLAIGAMAFGLFMALPLGIVAALKRSTKTDYLSMAFAIIGYSMPSFWLGIILIWILAVKIQWFPVMGYVPLSEDPVQWLYHLLLPSFTLGTFLAGYMARLTRSSLLEVLTRDYIKAAKAKGVRQATLVVKHALRNALIPVVTVIGLLFGGLLGGAVLTETIFTIPGMGKLIVTAIFNREYQVVQAAVLIGVVITITVNLVVDLLYALINPRIRYQQ